MKRIFAVLLALSLLLLAACSKGVSPTEPSPTEPATQAPTEPATDAPTEPSQTEPATEPSQPTEEEGPFTVTYAHAQADTHGSGEVWVQLLAEVTNTGSEPLTLGAADWTVCTPDGTELFGQILQRGIPALQNLLHARADLRPVEKRLLPGRRRPSQEPVLRDEAHALPAIERAIRHAVALQQLALGNEVFHSHPPP